jgi:Tfp pilus assembly protein PilF
MSRSAKLSKAVMAAVAISLPGCAGGSLFGGGSSQDPSAVAVANQSQSPSAFKKATTAVADALTIEPKVVPAPDATSLASNEEVGPEVYLAAARLHETQNDMAGAAAQYQKALRADPKNLTALVSYARLHDREKRFDRAIELYQRAITAHPQSAVVRNDLGLCLARQGKTAESIQSLERAVQLDPKKKLYRNNLAKVLVGESRIDDAWKHLSAVHEPHVAHYNLGYLLHGEGRTVEAVEQLQLALELRPAFAEASQMLARLDKAPAQGPAHQPPGDAPVERFVSTPSSAPVAEPRGEPRQSLGPATWRLNDDVAVERTPAIEEETSFALEMPASRRAGDAYGGGEPAPTPQQYDYEFGAGRISHLPPVDGETR